MSDPMSAAMSAPAGVRASSPGAAARLDRLPPARFQRRVMRLIGLGMFFDGFDIYMASSVLGATLKSGFSTLAENALFISSTFFGMMLGALASGFIGDRFGRRVTYQANLALFGGAALVSAFAPNMSFLIVCRFFMGLGLGAEIVVGYATLAEFVPPAVRGRQQGLMAAFVCSALPVSALLGLLLVPSFGWRVLYVIGGLGALWVWYARKALPESPRWLEATGRHADAQALLVRIEQEVAREVGALPEPSSVVHTPSGHGFRDLFTPRLLPRMLTGSFVLIVINTLLYGFVSWLPTFFVAAGMTIVKSFTFAFIMSLGAPLGAALGALGADRLGRKRLFIVASSAAALIGGVYPFVRDPVLLPVVGFLLVVPIYVLVALCFAIYVPELFPTEVRLRATGLCNTVGRGATIGTPFLVVRLYAAQGVTGVLGLMLALLLVQIVVVAWFGVEASGRTLEAVSQANPAS
jgi:putative MFS transporter